MADEESASFDIDENDISVFRKVHPSAKLSRGRSIAHILYERSIHGSNVAGGFRRSLYIQNASDMTQASPSSVILPPTTRNDIEEPNDADSLSEVLAEGNDSLDEVIRSHGRERSAFDDYDRNRPKADNAIPSNVLPSRDPTNGIHNPNTRLKLNAYPTNISNEIRNFAEHCSVTNFQSDYLSLDRMKPLTDPSARHDTHRRRSDADDTEFAVSTISIAFSPDGRTIASTHGDHTVKISCCNTGALIRNLEGHPRTPWTVKYHPTQSNIVASGCLGHQVRIWDWNHVTNGKGAGYEDEEDESDAKYRYHERKGVCLKMIRLRNSIISLSFHPTGSILAIACGHTLHLWVYDNEAKSKSKNGRNQALTSDDNRAAPDDEQNEGENDGQENGQTLLHQIRYANNLRCVHFPPGGDTIIIGGVNPNTDNNDSSSSNNNNNETSYSLLLLDFDLSVALMSPTEFNYFQSTDPEDRRPKPSIEVLKNYRTFLPRALLYNDGGFDVSADGKRLCGCADLWLPFGVSSAAELIEREENERIALMERSFNDSSLSTVATPSRYDRKKRKDMDGSESVDCPYHSPPRQGTLPAVTDCQTPPNPSRPDPTSPPSPPGRRWVPAFDRRSTNGNQADSDLLPPRSKNRRQITGGRYVPHVIVVSLDDNTNALGESTLGKVIEATPLESRATSVTCVKFSPSSEYCLIGYGVREQGQDVPYHPVNSLYRVKGGMAHISTMLSENDDVNISRFHPHSGVGFVYGTKQGRVRVLSPRPWNYYYD